MTSIYAPFVLVVEMAPRLTEAQVVEVKALLRVITDQPWETGVLPETEWLVERSTFVILHAHRVLSQESQRSWPEVLERVVHRVFPKHVLRIVMDFSQRES